MRYTGSHMAASFFFYDLETSGLDPKYARIMQFAGQRTDTDLNPIGEPYNILIKLTPDVLPDPDAIMVTGITPQSTVADGVTEAEFLKRFCKEIAVPQTTFLGYNSVRFDDEFMRYLHYRNFYDAYEWQWCDSCSRWDMLDVVRMTRALRPDGISWPFASDGSPSNRLEHLTKVNKLNHYSAHDALSDVLATIAVAKLIKTKQSKLFQYLFEMRDKKKVAALVQSRQPFVYTSGAYRSEHEKATIAMMVLPAPTVQGALVYDLRYDPSLYADLSARELAKRMQWQPKGSTVERLPVKTVRFNRCPAVAPLSVIDKACAERLKLDLQAIEVNRKTLETMTGFTERLAEAVALNESERSQVSFVGNENAVDGQLYDGFLQDPDRKLIREVRATDPAELGSFTAQFKDTRMQALIPLYKARNYPEALSPEERGQWESFCRHRLLDGGAKSRMALYFDRLQSLATAPTTNQSQQYLLEELRLYGESLMPAEELV